MWTPKGRKRTLFAYIHPHMFRTQVTQVPLSFQAPSLSQLHDTLRPAPIHPLPGFHLFRPYRRRTGSFFRPRPGVKRTREADAFGPLK